MILWVLLYNLFFPKAEADVIEKYSRQKSKVYRLALKTTESHLKAIEKLTKDPSLSREEKKQLQLAKLKLFEVIELSKAKDSSD